MKPYVSKVLLPLVGTSAGIALAVVFFLGGRQILPGVEPAVGSDDNRSQLVADASKPNPEEGEIEPESDLEKEGEPESDLEKEGTEPESDLDKEGTEPKSDLDKEGVEPESDLEKEGEPSSEPSNEESQEESENTTTYLDIQSNPPGARVEVGIQFNGWKIVPGTGQKTCTTPCLVELDPADVAILPDGVANLVVKLDKTHFAPHIDVIELGKLDRIFALERGKTYSSTITLQHNDWLSKGDRKTDDSKSSGSSNSKDASKPDSSKSQDSVKVESKQNLK
jgi:hypothetical protein